ncbi:hypothetical protein V6Z11_D09G022700 [Gossypium hirsutum]
MGKKKKVFLIPSLKTRLRRRRKGLRRWDRDAQVSVRGRPVIGEWWRRAAQAREEAKRRQ